MVLFYFIFLLISVSHSGFVGDVMKLILTVFGVFRTQEEYLAGHVEGAINIPYLVKCGPGK